MHRQSHGAVAAARDGDHWQPVQIKRDKRDKSMRVIHSYTISKGPSAIILHFDFWFVQLYISWYFGKHGGLYFRSLGPCKSGLLCTFEASIRKRNNTGRQGNEVLIFWRLGFSWLCRSSCDCSPFSIISLLLLQEVHNSWTSLDRWLMGSFHEHDVTLQLTTSAIFLLKFQTWKTDKHRKAGHIFYSPNL